MRIFTLCSDNLPTGQTVHQSMWSGYAAGAQGLPLVANDLQSFLNQTLKVVSGETNLPQENMNIDDQINYHLDQLNKLRQQKPKE